MKNNTTQKNIPSKWKQKNLGEIASITNGSTNTQDAIIDGEYPLFDRSVAIKKSNKYLFNDIAIIVPGEGAEFIPRIYNGKFDLHQRAYAIFPEKNIVSPEYLYYFLYANRKDFLQKSVGSTVKSLRLPLIQSINVSIPLMQEQQKIAEILGAVDEDIAKTEEVIKATEKLKHGLIQGILSFENKEDVKYLAFGNIGKVSMCKRIFKKETSDTGDIPFYKIGTFGKEPDSFISQEIFDSYRNKFPFPKIGDILLSASGTIGRKVKYDGRPAYFQDSNIIWLEHDESKVLNSFLFHLYDTIKWQTEGSTIKRLYNDIFLRKVIPVPSINKQKQIVEILSAVDEKISINKKLKEKLTLLKKGLMQDLLSGKKRVNS